MRFSTITGSTITGMIATLVALTFASVHAWAQEPSDEPDTKAPVPLVSGSASGALGAGVIDASPTTALDVGVDLAGQHYAMGLGARLRWLVANTPDPGFRSADWDERSEWASLLRYLTYARAHDRVRVALAMGELGGLTLGHGSLVDGYSAGLDIDHRHLGAEVRVESEHIHGTALIDDLVVPRIVAVRAGWRAPGTHLTWSASASSAVDLSAPERRGGLGPTMESTAALPLASLDGRAEIATADRRMGGAFYVDLVAISTMALGAHAGLGGHMEVWGRTRVSLRGELRAGSDHYIPGWFGPLYELTRRAQGPGQDMPMNLRESQLDTARAGGLGGLGALVEAQVAVPHIGDFAVYYTRRSGLADQFVARATVPFLRDVQGAAWLAAEVGDGAEAWILASELRLRIRDRWFASAEFSRLYIERDEMLAPIYTGLVTGGMTVDL